MDYILIEMHTVIIVLAVMCLLGVGIFLISMSLAEEKCKTRHLIKRNIFLRERLSSTQQDLYRATFKLPEYEDLNVSATNIERTVGDACPYKETGENG